jgi:prephenate dehydrogenase
VTAHSAINRAFDAEEGASDRAPIDGQGPFAIPDLGERSPELKQTREHIDAVDREIIRLLARRAQLARRAADAKLKLGAPVLDAAREAEVMRARRDWAAEMRLDQDGVAAIFEDVIKMARRAQRE